MEQCFCVRTVDGTALWEGLTRCNGRNATATATPTVLLLIASVATVQVFPVQISMIMAMDRNRLIGERDGLPWHIPSDLQYFKRVTLHKPVIMGRVTFESIGRPLPGRSNLVITRNWTWSAPGVTVVSSLQEALNTARAEGAAESMIIGGASICQQAMPVTERLYLTVIDHEFSGDTWLDSFNWDDWTIVSTDPRDERDDSGYQFCYYVLDRSMAPADDNSHAGGR